MIRLVRLALIVVLLSPSAALAEGALYLQSFYDELETGVAGAQFWAYTDAGILVHSGQGSGAYTAGEYLSVEEGFYWVEIGQYRTEHNLQRLYVREGRTTVIPSGWVSVTTHAPSEQPAGCENWNAELTGFTVNENGEEFLVTSNRGTGVFDYGMIQLPVGNFLVYFNGMPIEVPIQAGKIYRLPTGFQPPVAGDRSQISLTGPEESSGVTRSMCDSGMTHVPAGDYWVSRIVPTSQYPYEERVWDRVTVMPDNPNGYVVLRAERVRSQFHGDGSEPTPIDSTYTETLENYRRGAVIGTQQSGFDGALPGLEIGL